MRMRLGAPLAAVLVGLLGLVQSASASHFGAAGYDGFSPPCCDAQSGFPAGQPPVPTGHKHCWEKDREKRRHPQTQNRQEKL